MPKAESAAWNELPVPNSVYKRIEFLKTCQHTFSTINNVECGDDTILLVPSRAACRIESYQTTRNHPVVLPDGGVFKCYVCSSEEAYRLGAAVHANPYSHWMVLCCSRCIGEMSTAP